MMVIIIGKNRVEYCKVKNKDLSKHYFVTRDQLYKVYPDALTPMELIHDGAHVSNESVIVFEENGTVPYHCTYPHDYDMDSILASLDEHKLMTPRKKKLFFSISSSGIKSLIGALPLIIVGAVVMWTVIF